MNSNDTWLQLRLKKSGLLRLNNFLGWILGLTMLASLIFGTVDFRSQEEKNADPDYVHSQTLKALSKKESYDYVMQTMDFFIASMGNRPNFVVYRIVYTEIEQETGETEEDSKIHLVLIQYILNGVGGGKTCYKYDDGIPLHQGKKVNYNMYSSYFSDESAVEFYTTDEISAILKEKGW